MFAGLTKSGQRRPSTSLVPPSGPRQRASSNHTYGVMGTCSAWNARFIAILT
jgi:hypothetical protein